MTYTSEQLLEAADILDAAHDVILARGWWGISSVNDWTAVCMETAVNVACGECDGKFLPCSPFATALPYWLVCLLHERGVSYTWNDAMDRTEDEVFDRLRSVAKELREEAG